VQRWLEEQSDLSLAELADRLQAECGLYVSVSCVSRLMRRLHMRRKKIYGHPPFCVTIQRFEGCKGGCTQPATGMRDAKMVCNAFIRSIDRFCNVPK
jgi:hypothetical protein